MPHGETRDAVAAGRLQRVLQSFIPCNAGLFLHLRMRSQSQQQRKAFIEMACDGRRASLPRQVRRNGARAGGRMQRQRFRRCRQEAPDDVEAVAVTQQAAAGCRVGLPLV